MIKTRTISVSVRLSPIVHAELIAEAERRNTNISEILRMSWRVFNQTQKVELQLLNMEQRLTKNLVETVFLGCNLNEEEKADGKQKLTMMGVKW